MSLPTVRTLFDAIAHLDVYARGSGPSVAETSKRQAALDAYDVVTNERHWRHFVAKHRIYFDAPYSTGTVSYSTSTGKLTLDGGTFPTWAAHGYVKIGDVISKVDAREGATVLALDANQNPQVAVAADTAYTLYRVTYPLPDDLLGLYDVLPEANWIQPCSVHFARMHRNERYWQRSSSPPLAYDIEPDPTRLNGWQLRIFGYPSEGKTFDVLYHRQARPLWYDGSEATAKAGTVSCDKSTSVAGTSTTFADDMAGSMLLFGPDGSTYPESRGDVNRFTEQARIRGVGGAGNLTLYEPTSKTHSGVRYRVSDPVDLPIQLLEAYYRCCEWKLEISRSGSEEKAENRYKRELARAYGIHGIKLEVSPDARGGPFYELEQGNVSYLHGAVTVGVQS